MVQLIAAEHYKNSSLDGVMACIFGGFGEVETINGSACKADVGRVTRACPARMVFDAAILADFCACLSW